MRCRGIPPGLLHDASVTLYTGSVQAAIVIPGGRDKSKRECLSADAPVCGLFCVQEGGASFPGAALLVTYGLRPLTVNTSLPESFLPSEVQIAPWACSQR